VFSNSKLTVPRILLTAAALVALVFAAGHAGNVGEAIGNVIVGVVVFFTITSPFWGFVLWLACWGAIGNSIERGLVDSVAEGVRKGSSN
jgi:hypothetical protein